MSVTFESYLDDVNEQLNGNIDNILTRIGLYIESKTKLKITDYGAVDTGYLRNTVDHKVINEENKVIIGTNCEYAIYVHEGTRKMRKRQFLLDTVIEEKDEINNIVVGGFNG